MKHRALTTLAGLLATVLLNAGCAMGPEASGSFDRTLSVSGPIRLELNNTSGDVSITGSADGKVHVHGDARASGMGFESPGTRVASARRCAASAMSTSPTRSRFRTTQR